VDFTNPGGRIEVGSLSGPSLIHVRFDGRVLGAGTLKADSIQIDGLYGAGLTLDGNTTMGPSAIFSSAFPPPFSASRLASTSPAGVLRSFGRSPLVAAPAPPPSGPVTITGDAVLGGTLELSFLDGFAPTQGSQLQVLDVGGTVSGGFANVVARGVAGAAFDQSLQNGVLTLTSLTDAEPLPVVNLKGKTTLSEASSKKGLAVSLTRGGDRSQPLLVHYDLRGTARNALDYEALPGAIEIPAGKKSTKLLIRPIADGAGEPAESIEIELLPGDGFALGLSSKLEIALADEVAKTKKKRR
jgi:hypothetical protein